MNSNSYRPHPQPLPLKGGVNRRGSRLSPLPFESGLTFTKVQFMKEIDSDFCEDEMSSVINSLYGTYQVYGHNIFYNGITHDFGMDNIPGIDE
jgi:hypothetical protein